jgi:Tfp pilus assembly protein PilF
VAWATGNYTYIPGDVKICDVATGREIHTLRGHSAPVRAIAFSPDGTRLASASHDRTIKLWDMATGAEVFSLRAHRRAATCLAFSSDGHRLASGASDATAEIWDATPVPADRLEASARPADPSAWAAVNRNGYREAFAGRSGQVVSLLMASPDRRPGDIARALALAQKATELAPNNIAVLNNIAWFLAVSPQAPPQAVSRAVEWARKAVAMEPNNGALWNTRGMAHYRAGDWPAAIAALEESMKHRSGGDPSDWLFLAMAHWQKDEQEQARTWYDKSIAWMNKNPSRNEELDRFRAEAAALMSIDASEPKTRVSAGPTRHPD